MKTIPIEKALAMLNEAEQMNPGAWVQHSVSVADNAKIIAGQCNDMNPDTAYVIGLLHDIGRRAGVKHIMHIFDGYNYLMELGYNDAARICLTHSFPIKDINTFFGRFDCTQEEKQFLHEYLNEIEYTDYDRLIQLCDAISMPQGAVLMEKRFVDVAKRHGLPEFTLEKWQSFLDLKSYFDNIAGVNIYTILPNIVENTFK